jgi:P-type Cu2+ transporter
MSKEKINLNISGMTCVNCSNGIQRVVGKLDGLESSQVNFASNRGEFVIDTERLDKTTLVQKIKKLGYGVEEDIKALEKQKQKSYLKLKRTFILSAILTACMFALMLFPLKTYNLYLIFSLASIVQLYAGSRFYILGFKALRNKNFDMNVLVALGTSAAYFYSVAVVLFPHLFPAHLRFTYFDGASAIITFILLGRLLEERSKAKATDFLKRLMDLAPLNANLIEQNGEIKTVLASSLNIDDVVLIKQGEKVSTDAIIIEGEAEIDTSMITGEPMPAYKTIGDEVIAGTLNKTGTLKVKVLKRSSDTALSNIIALLNEAGSKKMPIARLADKIANIFVPTVISLSVLTFFVWFFVVGNSLSAILASISVLIISCPCALGLATPIAIVSAVGKGAKEGILIKNPEILEIIKDIKYAVFDKTGTLTEGKITLKEMLVQDEYKSLIASAELHSEHPISQAIVNFAKEHEIATNDNINDLKILPGRGISAMNEDKRILVGNLPLLQENNIQIEEKILQRYEKVLKEGNGVVLAAIESNCVGLLILEDSLKQNASKMIQELKKEHIIPVLLTGDNKVTAKKIAKEIDIDLVYAEVLPDEKYKLIMQLQEKAKVMFVGDGINDSISIKQADIGIALNSGSDITKDAGDIILMNNELSLVTKSIHLSRKAMSTIKQNLFWAFFYNAIGIPLAAGVLYPIIGVMLSPMYAGIAMSFSSVTVVLNSLRLKFSKL